jgi:hypothetical protein
MLRVKIGLIRSGKTLSLLTSIIFTKRVTIMNLDEATSQINLKIAQAPGNVLREFPAFHGVRRPGHRLGKCQDIDRHAQ